MAKFKVISIADLYISIPLLKEMATLKHVTDNDNIASIYEALDVYGEKNGMEFFQIHHRRDNVSVAIFKVKE